MIFDLLKITAQYADPQNNYDGLKDDIKFTLSVPAELHGEELLFLSCPSGLSWHHFVAGIHKLVMIPEGRTKQKINHVGDYPELGIDLLLSLDGLSSVFHLVFIIL